MNFLKSGIEKYKEEIKKENCFTCEHSKKLQFSKSTNLRNIRSSGLCSIKVHCEYKGLRHALDYCIIYDRKLEILDITDKRIEYKEE